MESLGHGAFRYTFLKPQTSLTFQATADGFRSAVGTLEVVPAPAIGHMALQYLFPDYTGLPGRTQEGGGDIQALPGSAAVRERMVTTWIRYLEALTKRAGNDWRLKAEIAAGYRRAAEAQGISHPGQENEAAIGKARAKENDDTLLRIRRELATIYAKNEEENKAIKELKEVFQHEESTTCTECDEMLWIATSATPAGV
jgi:hypothetical protein